MKRVFSLAMVCALGLGLASADAQKQGRGKRKRPPTAAQQPQQAPAAEDEVEANAEAAATSQSDQADVVIGVDEAESAEGGAAEPQVAAPEPVGEPAKDASQAELQALREELAQVMDRLVQTRARIAMLGKSLFKTRVRVSLRNEAGPDLIASKIVVLLDGAPIFSGDGSALDAEGYRQLFEGFAAPGPHVLTLEIEQQARDDDQYRYRLRESFHFSAPREHVTRLTLVLDDDSDMAEEFGDDHEGEYEVSTRLEARALELDED